MTTIAQTGAVFNSFDIYASINSQGTVVFNGSLTAGGQGIFTNSGGSLAKVPEPSTFLLLGVSLLDVP